MSSRSADGWRPEGLAFVAAALATTALWLWSPGLLGGEQQLAIVAAGALLGLPHGAVDPLRAWYGGLCRDTRTLAGFHIAYVLAALAVAGLWLAAPLWALGFFLALSAWHFADDWRHCLPLPVRLGLGCAVIALPVGFHGAEAAVIFRWLAGEQAAGLVTALTAAAWPLWSGVVTVAAIVALSHWRLALELAVIALAALVLPPLLFFVLFFALLHNGRHLRQTYGELPPGGRRWFPAVAVSYSLLAAGCALAAAPWLISLDLEALATLKTGTLDPGPPDAGKLVSQLVFAGLAAVTFPHVVLGGLIRRRQGRDAANGAGG